jgi:hypothetical protein
VNLRRVVVSVGSISVVAHYLRQPSDDQLKSVQRSSDTILKNISYAAKGEEKSKTKGQEYSD